MSKYHFDDNGRLIQVDISPDESIKYVYDQNGNLTFKSYGEPSYPLSSAYGDQQGKDNWFYQIWNGTNYENMTWDPVLYRWEGKNSWDLITKDWMHPDGNDAVLKWVAPQTGSIRIAGIVSKHLTNLQGDGVRVKIMKNQSQIWPASGWKTIEGNDATGFDLNLNVNVVTGDSIYFILNQNGNNGYDATRWNPSISYIKKASSAFGPEQGRNNWYYQIWNGTSYENMTWDPNLSGWRGKNSWDLITNRWMHPDGNDAVLKWVAPQMGSIRISGTVAKHPTNLQGDGIRVKIMKNTTQIWPASGWQSIEGNDAAGVANHLNLNVATGDAIYFILNQNGNNGYDATRWDPAITYVEKASSAYGAEQGRNNWYYQIWNGTSYESMKWNPVLSRWEGKNSWDLITKDWMHPDGNDTVLKWVAPQTGTIRIAGTAAKHPVNLQGDGVRIRIMQNSTQIWPASGWQSIQGTDSIGIAIHLNNIKVTAGDSIYFILNQNGNMGYDATAWDPSILYQ
ncbi:hypothetical protein ACP26L_28285 [Paenibacillus sp. S-38]|uniref:hypothetical protein n=1 Tax=Paenibacillus sp. S-38 TaxID=3416710 RepID=UPI003CE84014